LSPSQQREFPPDDLFNGIALKDPSCADDDDEDCVNASGSDINGDINGAQPEGLPTKDDFKQSWEDNSRPVQNSGRSTDRELKGKIRPPMSTKPSWPVKNTVSFNSSLNISTINGLTIFSEPSSPSRLRLTSTSSNTFLSGKDGQVHISLDDTTSATKIFTSLEKNTPDAVRRNISIYVGNSNGDTPNGLPNSKTTDRTSNVKTPIVAPPQPLGIHIGIIIGITCGVAVLLLVLAFAFYKYRSQEEGTYSLDVADNCEYEACVGGSMTNGRGARGRGEPGSRMRNIKGKGEGMTKKRQIKEWYV